MPTLRQISSRDEEGNYLRRFEIANDFVRIHLKLPVGLSSRVANLKEETIFRLGGLRQYWNDARGTKGWPGLILIVAGAAWPPGPDP